ncbi:hypothetical protein TNCV_2265971 [Trichonephila clavipes]|nr:hypothetical protein TNCV_2265971 [Trichonephila clavipes]
MKGKQNKKESLNVSEDKINPVIFPKLLEICDLGNGLRVYEIRNRNMPDLNSVITSKQNLFSLLHLKRLNSCTAGVDRLSQGTGQCRFIHWALGAVAQGPGEAQKGQDKLELAPFSGYKFRSSSTKGACRSSAPRARNELKSALPWYFKQQVALSSSSARIASFDQKRDRSIAHPQVAKVLLIVFKFLVDEMGGYEKGLRRP